FVKSRLCVAMMDWTTTRFNAMVADKEKHVKMSKRSTTLVARKDSSLTSIHTSRILVATTTTTATTITSCSEVGLGHVNYVIRRGWVWKGEGVRIGRP